MRYNPVPKLEQVVPECRFYGWRGWVTLKDLSTKQYSLEQQEGFVAIHEGKRHPDGSFEVEDSWVLHLPEKV